MTIALHLAPDHRVYAYMLLLSMTAAIAFGNGRPHSTGIQNPTLLPHMRRWKHRCSGGCASSGLRETFLVGLQVAVSLGYEWRGLLGASSANAAVRCSIVAIRLPRTLISWCNSQRAIES